MTRWPLYLGVTFLMLASPVIARNQPATAVVADGITTLEGPDGMHIAVRITSHVLSDAVLVNRAQVPARACTESRTPCSVIDDIAIRVQGKDVFVPKGAYVGLSDAISAMVSGSGDNFMLRITGGDASETYIAALSFDQQRVKRRSIAPGTEPGTPLEETTYHLVTSGD